MTNIPGRPLSRHERDLIAQRYIIIGAIIFGVALLAVLGFALYDYTVVQPEQPVARVGTETITTREFQRAMRYTRFLQGRCAIRASCRSTRCASTAIFSVNRLSSRRTSSSRLNKSSTGCRPQTCSLSGSMWSST